MKKILYTLILAASATSINAQLVVDSLGRVGIGTESPKSMLSIGGEGDSLTMLSCNPNNKEVAISFSNITSSANGSFGGVSISRNLIGDCTGAKIKAYGKNDMDLSQKAIGVLGCAGRTHTAVGIFGGKQLGNTVNFAGVFGTSSTTSTPYFSNYSGNYAGFFDGKVRVTNGIYATVLSPSASASPSGEGGTTILSDRGESVTDKLSQVQAVQFLRYDPMKETKTEKLSLTDIDIENLSPEELDSLAANTGEEPEQYLSPIQYGLAADQLKAVYPELVYEDANGNISINYIEMIPLLVQSIKELSAKVETLEQQLGAKKSTRKSKQQTTAVEKTNVVNTDKDGTTYDLSGRLVANPHHGVYVQNGKKVAVK